MRIARTPFLLLGLLVCTSCLGITETETWLALPATDGTVVVPAQTWPRKPGPRTVTVHIRYPNGSLAHVQPGTGLLLSLHNWGGTGFTGAPDPVVLAERYNVVAIGVDYLQSGPYDAKTDPPYDFGWYQALDALRGLYFIWQGLDASGKPFDRSRVYVTGGSGGGNVSLMANKLAPRTFACVVDLSGMAKLSDDIAYGEPGRTRLNAGYSRDPQDSRYLSVDDQAIRFVGFPAHAATMKQLGNEAKIVVVHGVDDDACPIDDAKEMADNLHRAGLDVTAHFITQSDIDGDIFKDCRHSLGDRTRIVQHVADPFLFPTGASAAVRAGKADFDRRDESVRYATANGCFVVSYAAGYPVGRFEKHDAASLK